LISFSVTSCLDSSHHPLHIYIMHINNLISFFVTSCLDSLHHPLHIYIMHISSIFLYFPQIHVMHNHFVVDMVCFPHIFLFFFSWIRLTLGFSLSDLSTPEPPTKKRNRASVTLYWDLSNFVVLHYTSKFLSREYTSVLNQSEQLIFLYIPTSM
jgi:hypothetical protein